MHFLFYCVQCECGMVVERLGLAGVSRTQWGRYLHRDPELNWPASGPKVLWKAPIKNGFSSLTIADGKAFTQMNRDLEGANREVCVALNASTGKEIWAVPVGVGVYDGGGDSGTPDNKGGDGPRSTPTVSAGKVYVFNQLLVLFCLDADSGQV